MHSRSFLAYLSLALSLALGVSAQQPTAQCLPGWEWNRNSLGQDPCVIGMKLDDSCRGNIGYTYPKLEKTQYYVPPNKSRSEDLDCDCNTVMYSLIMACATCQEGVAYEWSAWALACTGVYIAQLPHDIPQRTAVPRWAFYNVTTLTGGKYNDNAAKAIGRDPEEMPKPQSTVTKPSPTGPTGSRSPSGGGKTAAVVGGVVGGAGALIIIPIIAYFVFRRIRKNRNKKLQSQYQETPTDTWKASPSSPTYQQSFSTEPTVRSSVHSQSYNPWDPRTFPHPMGQTHQPAARPPITFVTPLKPNYGARR